MTVPFNSLKPAEDTADIKAAIDRVIASGWFVLGPEVDAFEAEFAAASGVAHAVGVGTGTDAIMLIFRGLDIGPGDEVITPPLSAAYFVSNGHSFTDGCCGKRANGLVAPFHSSGCWPRASTSSVGSRLPSSRRMSSTSSRVAAVAKSRRHSAMLKLECLPPGKQPIRNGPSERATSGNTMTTRFSAS